jgi:hypothetical protein
MEGMAGGHEGRPPAIRDPEAGQERETVRVGKNGTRRLTLPSVPSTQPSPTKALAAYPMPTAINRQAV